MTAPAESSGSGWGQPETDLFAGRISGSVAPLLPTNLHHIAIEEALARFGPGLQNDKFSTSFSNAQIGNWVASTESPPLAALLIAAHKLQTGERSPAENRNHKVAATGSAALKAVGFGLEGIGSVVPAVGGIFKAAGGLVVAVEYGVEAADHNAQGKLFAAVARRVRRNYGVSYNNNPLEPTGPEERSLAAWLLAESLVQLCEDGRVRPGCESLADNIAVKLLNLYAQKIRIDLPRKVNDTRPPGIELLELCERLNNWVDIGVAADNFVIATQAAREKRQIDGENALRIKRPTSEPPPTALGRMLSQSRKYQETSYNDGPELYDIAKKYVEQYNLAEAASHPTGPLLDDLIELWMVARDCLAANPVEGQDRQGFRDVCELVAFRYGAPVVARVLDELPAIATGEAQLAVQKLAYHILFEQQTSFKGQSKADLENALYRAAQLWYRQPAGQYYTSRIYKQRQGKFGAFEEAKYQLRQFSHMNGIKREAGELMIQTYLYQATALSCRPDDAINKVRLRALKKSFTAKPEAIQRLILHDLPPACAQMFR